MMVTLRAMKSRQWKQFFVPKLTMQLLEGERIQTGIEQCFTKVILNLTG